MDLNFNKFAVLCTSFFENLGIITPLRLIRIKYFLKFRRSLLIHNPKNLNEKIIWLSFNTDTSIWTTLADKYKVRKYVQECGLEELLVKLYDVYNNPDEIDFDKLPQSFVLKTNNGCGSIYLVKDKQKLNIVDVKQKLNKWLKKPFGLMSAEPHYRRIKPCIIAEEYLVENNSFSSSLVDYKFWCFNGEPYYVLTVCNRDTEKHRIDLNLYEPKNWVQKSDYISDSFRNNISIPQPQKLQEMIEAARILSKSFPQVRVDFYEVNGKVYFGEMTFTSNGGLMKYFTEECLLEMGRKIDLDKIKTA